MNNNTITLGEVRFSYLHVFEPQARPNGDPKYGVTILLPKTNTAAKAAIDAAIGAAIEAGVSKCWSGVRPPMPAICVHDGDGPRPSDGQPFGEECRGMWVFTAYSTQQPFIVDGNVQPIIDKREIYSGAYGRVNVTFFAYFNSGKKGVGCGLNGVQKTRDGEPLSARVTAEDAFGAPVTPAYGAAMPATGYPQQAYAIPSYGQPAPTYPQQPAMQPINPFTGLPF